MGDRVGSGSYGCIYEGMDVITRCPVAIKCEPAAGHRSSLGLESRVYNLLKGTPGFADVFYYGSRGDLNILITELLGKSLDSLLTKSSVGFSLKTVLMLADEMISRLRYLHMKGIVHRDVKPENFVIGTGANSHVLYLIDFGLVKLYRDASTNRHNLVTSGNSFVGTTGFASVNTHEGLEQSRRDDMESLAYTLIWLLKGTLPWSHVPGTSLAEIQRQVYELKRDMSPSDICEGLPHEFEDFLKDVRSLGHEQEPDYAGYQRRFRYLFEAKHYVFDYHYDWCPKQKPVVVNVPRGVATCHEGVVSAMTKRQRLQNMTSSLRRRMMTDHGQRTVEVIET